MDIALNVALALKLLMLLLVANGTPVLVKRLFGDKWSYPLDAGLRFFDGRPLFGPSKTVRGVVCGVTATAVMAPLLGFSWFIGAAFGIAALGGDVFSSFVKRRLNIPSSGMALGLDQIPEALLPLWMLRTTLGLDWWSICILIVLFAVGGLMLSRILFRFGVRDRPY